MCIVQVVVLQSVERQYPRHAGQPHGLAISVRADLAAVRVMLTLDGMQLFEQQHTVWHDPHHIRQLDRLALSVRAGPERLGVYY